MADLQPTDLFLVNRSNVTSTVTSENLMATILDDDLLLVNRGDVASTITGADFKESLGNKPIFPEPDEITGSPNFQGGTGTELDPFLLQTIGVRPGGAVGVSVETITIAVAGATEGDIVVWTDNSTGAGTRFTQPTGVVGADGTWSGKFVYTDSPATTVDTDYTGNLQIGDVYFRWIVQQGIDAIRPIDPSPDEITASPDFQSGTGTVGDPYILKTQTCAPAGSNVSSVEEITIAEVGAGAGELVRWTVDNTRFTQPEGLTDSSGVWTGRLVYNDTPDTTIDQTYIGNLQIGQTYFRWSVDQRVSAAQAPVVNGVSLIETNPDADPRFTSQSFVVQGTMTTDGIPTSEKTIDAHVDGTLSRQVQFNEPLESSIFDASGVWTGVPAQSSNWLCVGYGNGRYVALPQRLYGNQAMHSDDGITWTLSSALPMGGSSGTDELTWNSVAYGISSASGNGIWVGVTGTTTGENPQVIYSQDNGATWSLNSQNTNAAWKSVIYADGKFVAVASNGTNLVMYSTDGINWTLSTAAEANDWSGVAYGNGKFVAVANSGTNRVMYSEDNGLTWKNDNVTGVEANAWRSVTYANGKFVAVASTGTNRVMYSDNDGLTWKNDNVTGVQANYWASVNYGNGKFVAVARDGTNRVMNSTDGISWTAASAEEANDWRSVTYGNGKFVAVASSGTNRVMWSTNGMGTTTDLTFAADADMEGLAGGDTVNQTNNFTEPLESSATGTVYSDGTVPIGGNWQEPPANAFQGISPATQSSYIGNTAWVEGVPNTRIEVSFADKAIPASGYVDVWTWSGADIAVEFYDGNGSQLSGITNRVENAQGNNNVNVFRYPAVATEVLISKISVSRGVGGAFMSAIDWNGTFLLDDAGALTFANDADMENLAAGDTVNQTNNFTELLESQGSSPGPNYSSYLTCPTGFQNNHGPDRAFDGATNEPPYANSGAPGSEPPRMTWDCSSYGFTDTDTVELWFLTNGSWVEFIDTNGTVVGGKIGNMTAQSWWSPDTGAIPNLAAIRTYNKANQAGGISSAWAAGVRVNGTILRDGQQPGVPALIFATGTDMSALEAGDAVSQGATSGTVGSITDTTATLSSSSGTWVNGTDVTTGDKTTTGTVAFVSDTTAILSSSSGAWGNGFDVTTGNKTTTGTVAGVSDTTATLSSSSGSWANGFNVTGPQKTIVEDNARLYCVFDSSGNISDLQSNPQDPPYTTTDDPADLTLTFPATFPSGQTPDDELPDGTTLTVDFAASNSSGTSGPVSATVQPEPGSPAPFAGLTTTRSQTAEEFAETQLKMLTYKNRSDIKKGEEALDARNAIIAEAEDLGITKPMLEKLYPPAKKTRKKS